MNINVSALTTCSVLPDGQAISLGALDENGCAVEFVLSTSDAVAMNMSLPKLLSLALKAKFKDDSLRHVFSLDDWRIEAASDGDHVIITLAAPDGFDVSFATNPDTCQGLGRALQEDVERKVKRAAILRN